MLPDARTLVARLREARPPSLASAISRTRGATHAPEQPHADLPALRWPLAARVLEDTVDEVGRLALVVEDGAGDRMELPGEPALQRVERDAVAEHHALGELVDVARREATIVSSVADAHFATGSEGG